MRPVALFLTAAGLVAATPAMAQDVFPNIEYISGKSGFNDKIKGQLVLGETDLSFVDKEGAPIFKIPLSQITEVSNSVEENPGSTGRKLLLGVFANKKEEYVYVTDESTEGAEGVVFKTKNKMSPGIIAKIRFAAKKVGGGQGAAAPAQPADSQ